ncbi:MAG: folate-binding protein YgfZ [Methylococcales bacterium]|jgi:tRNA-modifying protein YgfZ|nr:folate-binding protein YgfZ [Methylococcales bacterium]MBT7445813.1 folate-binding protein YgfZ [Methylococcales bacterium]
MNESWQAFLTNNGAHFDGNLPSWPASEHSDRLYDLSDYGVIEATGDDTVTFFQGQLTNNMTLITEQLGQFSSSCSPKGRMLASIRIFKRNDAYYIMLPQPLMEAMVKRFRMYVMMSKVVLTDVSDQFALTAIEGNTLLSTLGSQLSIPDENYGCHTDNGITVLRVEQNRVLIFAPNDTAQNLWLKLSGNAQLSNSIDWRRSEIMAGIPTITTETVESFVPQMANIQLINGVSFDKGCYTGQEVVARIHFLGKLKKRMYQAELKIDEAPLPGSKLFVADNEQSIGEIVDIQATTENTYVLLAVIQIAKADNTILAGSPTGVELSLQSLPYEFPE